VDGGLGLSNALVMLLMPALGAYADLRAAKKRLLAMATLGCVAATAALSLAGPGDLWLAMAAVVVSNLCYAIGESLIAAFLPELSRREAMGTVSGWGWSFGYFGGMLRWGLSLAWVLSAQGRGQRAQDFVPVTMLITAAAVCAGIAAHLPAAAERAWCAPGRAPRGRRRCSACCTPGGRRGSCVTSPGCWPVAPATRPASWWSLRWPRCTPKKCWASSRARP
jgi:UMF1 family MFS transporter